MTRFISCTDADVVMRTLEMRFGNSRLIADSILGQFRQLSNLIDDISRLVEFAIKLQNAVAAIKAVDIDGQGYLQNPELLERVLHELPRFMLTIYAHYRPTFSSSKSDLERVSDFLLHEAQLNMEAGTISRRFSGSITRAKRPRSKDRFTYVVQHAEEPEVKRPRKPDCLFCKRTNHALTDCRTFSKERVAQRWKFAKNENLCYLCLQKMS